MFVLSIFYLSYIAVDGYDRISWIATVSIFFLELSPKSEQTLHSSLVITTSAKNNNLKRDRTGMSSMFELVVCFEDPIARAVCSFIALLSFEERENWTASTCPIAR